MSKIFNISFFKKFCTESIRNSFKRMPLPRYFPNPSEDLNDSRTADIEVPQDYLKAAVQKLVKTVETKFKPQRESKDIYLGVAGIGYMFYHLEKLARKNKNWADLRFMDKAIYYLAQSLPSFKPVKCVDDVAFILGPAGIYAMATVLFSKIGQRDRSQLYREWFNSLSDICKKPHFLSYGCNELFVGRAGYVLGAIWIAKETGVPIEKKEIYKICNLIVESGHEYSQKHKCKSPLMFAYYGTEYLGAAHGLCSILQVLISVPGYIENNPNTKAIRESIDYLLSLQDPEGNFPCSTDEIGNPVNELVHWCHGAGGVIYLMAKAYLVFHDEKYLNSCERMGELIWRKGLLKKGPGICHGVAGNGYCFLLLYRLTKRPMYLYRAIEFAKFMETETFKKHSRNPDSPYSLYEGIGGTACFLADLTCPETAEFPFFDVFA